MWDKTPAMIQFDLTQFVYYSTSKLETLSLTGSSHNTSWTTHAAFHPVGGRLDECGGFSGTL